MLRKSIEMMEKGMIPDALVRFGIRKLCKDRLDEYRSMSTESFNQYVETYIRGLEECPVAIHETEANEQHYELPYSFFSNVLGPHLKYSSCYFQNETDTLETAERASLEITCERAQLMDGEQILELGCGWGSLSLFMAARYPNSRIVSVSNSASQREYIEGQARRRGLTNLTVLTRNVAHLTDLDKTFGKFDRAVSVEMFEHMKNYRELLGRISSWLKPEGTLFVHIFTHKEYPYPFETKGEDNWMGKYFFTGGQMPSHTLLSRFQENLRLENTWHWNGNHYARTAECWLENMDTNRDQVMSVLVDTYGKAEARLWFNRWRVFFMSCAELFRFDQGRQWGVSHYLFKNRRMS